MGDSPSKGELESLHRASARRCRRYETFLIGWMLGYARSLHMIERPGSFMRRRPRRGIDAHEFFYLRDFLAKPRCSLLQTFGADIDPLALDKVWSRAMSLLPSSCTRFRATPTDWTEEEARRVIDTLPAQITHLECGALPRGTASVPWLLDDRFEEVDLRSVVLDGPLADALARRLEARTRVRVRLGSVMRGELLHRLGERAVVGAPDDAALVNEATGAVILLPRWSLYALQQRNGIITARAQLTRSVPETFGIEPIGGSIVATGGDLLVRRGEGDWSARVRAPEREDTLAISLLIDGRTIGVDPVPFRSGALFELNGERYQFIEHMQ